MASPHDIRRLALRALYQLDLRGEEDADAIAATLARPTEDGDTGPDPDSAARAMCLAVAAFRDRADADRATEALAPTWPASRQPAMDRAILRLAFHEIAAGTVPPVVAIDEAVELAKEFSTEKSPAFVNALLDRIVKGRAGGEAEPLPGPDAPDQGGAAWHS